MNLPRSLMLHKKTRQVLKASRSPKAIQVLDQLSMELESEAQKLRLDVESEEFGATWLLACSLLKSFSHALKESDTEGSEIGSAFLGEAAWRLTQVGMWGRINQVSLEEMPPVGDGWSVENLMEDTG